MARFNADIVIFGAGIAGLWTFHRLCLAGYDAILLTDNGIGHGQTLASQGIIHSGLKYTLAGKINKLAKSISEMPERWLDSMYGKGDVDLTHAARASDTQIMLIPEGFMGGIVKIAAKKMLHGNAHEISTPVDILNSGFTGSVFEMGEPVLNIQSVIHSLSTGLVDRIFTIDPLKVSFQRTDKNDISSIEIEGTHIVPKQVLFTAAGSNLEISKTLGHNENLETQHRPLVMGMMKDAPYPLFAHLIGKSDKPLATITTHETKSGDLIWYFGGQVAERPLNADPKETISACKGALHKYLSGLALNNVKWSTLAIDRIEGIAGKKDFMPDMPTLHHHRNATYAWPTKLTFAPMLADIYSAYLDYADFVPSEHDENWSACPLPRAKLAEPPWETAQWS